MTFSAEPMQIFIVGGPRSGTSKIANSLRRAMGYPHFGEGHWLTLFNAIGRAIEQHRTFYAEAYSIKANWVAQIDRTELMRVIAGFILRDRVVNGVVIDKTPGRANMMALLNYRHLLPNCRLIVMTRRGIENVGSRTRKWPTISFQQHCQNWRDDLKTSLKILESGTPATRIDQYELAHNPELVARKLTRFLDLDETQSRALRKTLADANPEVTRADYRPLTLPETGWNESQIATFRATCSEMMERGGYSFDASYWINRPSEDLQPAPPFDQVR